MEKLCGKQTDQDLWVTITDAISWALIEHNRLNWSSPSGLLPKWGINPSTSLKCTVTDSGKLPSAGLFACLLAPRLPNLPCGKALIKKVWCLISRDCWHNYVLQRAKQCLETNWERGLRAAAKWYESVFHMEPWMSRTKPVDFGKSTWGETIYAFKLRTHQSWNILFQFWRLTAFDLGASGHWALLYFVCASRGSDHVRKWDSQTPKIVQHLVYIMRLESNFSSWVGRGHRAPQWQLDITNSFF